MQPLPYGMVKRIVPRTKAKVTYRTYFREWRKHRKLTLEQAAERAEMTAGNISAMERGTQGYTKSGLEALAAAYRCDPAHLLTVDPAKGGAIWSLWDKATPTERTMIVNIAKQIISDPDPDDSGSPRA